MEKLIIEATLNSPGITLDPGKNLFEFVGESRPEDVRKFYMPVLEWLEGYAGELSTRGKSNGKVVQEFHFNFEYFNSTSAKYLLDIFKTLNRIHTQGNEVCVKWHYEEDDEDMLEVGMEMSRMSKLPFEYVKTEV
jgi:hypothetical protein